MKISSIHYGWIIAITGVLVMFSCIGLARFGFAVLIPGMQAGLHLSYQHIGFIGTSNFIGYLIAVFFAPSLMKAIRPRAMVALGLALIGLSMLFIGTCESFMAVCAGYTCTGIGTGFSNIPMMTLTAQWFGRSHRGKAAGLVVCGNGIGIILVGYIIPFCTSLFGAEGWRKNWLILGITSLAVAIGSSLLLRNDPAEMGLAPVGSGAASRISPPAARSSAGEEARGFLVRIGLLYLVFGVTFMIYGTFIVTTMINGYGLSEKTAGMYWSWVGFFSFFSGIAFGALSDRIGRRYGLMSVFLVQTISYLLAGFNFGKPGLLISIMLYGLAVFAAPAIVTAAIGDHCHPSRIARAFSNATFLFAIGQTIGPAFAGLVGGEAANFSTAYQVAALLTAIAALGALTLPVPSKR